MTIKAQTDPEGRFLKLKVGTGERGIHVTMVDVEEQLLAEIADKRMKRDDVALTYAFGIRDCPDEVDWATVNRRIIDRWSMAALKYIKEQAWKIVRGESR